MKLRVRLAWLGLTFGTGLATFAAVSCGGEDAPPPSLEQATKSLFVNTRYGVNSTHDSVLWEGSPKASATERIKRIDYVVGFYPSEVEAKAAFEAGQGLTSLPSVFPRSPLERFVYARVSENVSGTNPLYVNISAPNLLNVASIPISLDAQINIADLVRVKLEGTAYQGAINFTITKTGLTLLRDVKLQYQLTPSGNWMDETAFVAALTAAIPIRQELISTLRVRFGVENNTLYRIRREVSAIIDTSKFIYNDPNNTYTTTPADEAALSAIVASTKALHDEVTYDNANLPLLPHGGKYEFYLSTTPLSAAPQIGWSEALPTRVSEVHEHRFIYARLKMDRAIFGKNFFDLSQTSRIAAVRTRLDYQPEVQAFAFPSSSLSGQRSNPVLDAPTAAPLSDKLQITYKLQPRATLRFTRSEFLTYLKFNATEAQLLPISLQNLRIALGVIDTKKYFLSDDKNAALDAKNFSIGSNVSITEPDGGVALKSAFALGVASAYGTFNALDDYSSMVYDASRDELLLVNNTRRQLWILQRGTWNWRTYSTTQPANAKEKTIADAINDGLSQITTSKPRMFVEIINGLRYLIFSDGKILKINDDVTSAEPAITQVSGSGITTNLIITATTWFHETVRNLNYIVLCGVFPETKRVAVFMINVSGGDVVTSFLTSVNVDETTHDLTANDEAGYNTIIAVNNVPSASGEPSYLFHFSDAERGEIRVKPITENFEVDTILKQPIYNPKSAKYLFTLDSDFPLSEAKAHTYSSFVLGKRLYYAIDNFGNLFAYDIDAQRRNVVLKFASNSGIASEETVVSMGSVPSDGSVYALLKDGTIVNVLRTYS